MCNIKYVFVICNIHTISVVCRVFLIITCMFSLPTNFSSTTETSNEIAKSDHISMSFKVIIFHLYCSVAFALFTSFSTCPLSPMETPSG